MIVYTAALCMRLSRVLYTVGLYLFFVSDTLYVCFIFYSSHCVQYDDFTKYLLYFIVILSLGLKNFLDVLRHKVFYSTKSISTAYF